MNSHPYLKGGAVVQMRSLGLSFAKIAEALEKEVEALRGLSRASECPDNWCKDGVVLNQHSGEIQPCQFCYERKILLEKWL